MEMERPNAKRKTKKSLVLWKYWSLDAASWTLVENFTSQVELKKMIERDNPVEDN